MSARSAVHGSSPALDRALGAGDGPEPVAHFLNDVAPGEVLGAVRRCLPAKRADPVLHLVRAKLKPGRKLTAEYDVVLPPEALARRISVTWVPPGATGPARAAGSEAEARRRGVLAPFRRSWIASDDGRMTVSVAPVDGAFPQLVRLHDPAHLHDVVRASGPAAFGNVAVDDLTVQTIRYRPGQRHVLRVGAGGDGPALFVKVYRDDTGRRTVDAAARAARAFAAAGDDVVAVPPTAGSYVAADRVAFWPEVAGLPLSQVIVLSGAAAGDVVRGAGSALRSLHEATSVPGAADGLLSCSDALGQAGETLRTAELVDVLAPAVGSRLRLEVRRVLELLAALPVEAPSVVHGDFKCDNLIVSGSRLHLLDFDRCGLGDPAADIGKFLADLRWWTGEDDAAAARLHEAFLEGYGVMGRARTARARAYDALLQLRMAARRVPIQDPGWERRVTRLVAVAAATAAGKPRP
jgi:aminoglycoside phosphotransferase (APT) family kinase protein